MSKVWTIPFLFLGLTSLSVHAAEDLIIEDFEKKSGVWTFEGSAFTGYGHGDYWHPGRFDRGLLQTRGHRGYAMLKSWGQHGRNVDGETGRALSPTFKVERNYVRFMISGGRAPGRTCVNLLVDGKIVRSATGNNSNQLKPVAFEVAEFRDKEARIEVIDRETGPWGHVCIDDLMQSDAAEGARLAKDQTTTGSDMLWTREGRLVGNLHWRNDELHLNGRSVQINAIKSISLQVPIAHDASPHAVSFSNGETWKVEILTLTKGKLTLRGDLFGERTVDLSSVASLEFAPKADRGPATRPGILYRTSGRPLPGKLTWIKKDDVAVDCALGIVPLPRKDLMRYVIPGASIQTKNESADEIGLTDGSILRGKARLENEKIILDHPVFETLTVPWEKLRYLIRSAAETLWLADLANRQVKSFGPLGSRTGVKHLDFRLDNKPYLSVVRVIPRSILRYKLPTVLKSHGRILRTVLAPIPGSLGDATVTLSMGDREFYRNELSAADGTEATRTLTSPS